MTIRVGIIGAGRMGSDHGRRLAGSIAGATVTAVMDADRSRAEDLAGELGGARVLDDAAALVDSDEVDAVLVASPRDTHAAYTLASIAAGKPVLCEKPLAPTSGECEAVLRAEAAGGRRLVTLGFMRRFDPGYLEVKRSLDSGVIGEALLLHNVHRNASVGESHTTMTTMTESLTHEADVTRWLLGEEITSVQVIPSRRSGRAWPHLQDPLFTCFTTESGILSTAEFFANCQYGYDVRCELVGSEGTASLLNPVLAGLVVAGRASEAVPQDWMARFAAAYAAELRTWIDGIERGECAGPSAWDGYAATRVTELGVEAIRSGRRVEIDYVERPAIYG